MADTSRTPVGAILAATLIIAIALNIGIAWTIAIVAQVNPAATAIRIREGDRRAGFEQNALHIWRDRARGDVRRIPDIHFAMCGPGWAMQIVAAAPSSADEQPCVDMLQTIEAGWPQRSMCGSTWRNRVPGTGTSESWRGVHFLPLRPMVGGFAWNTAVFWCILAGIVLIPRLIVEAAHWLQQLASPQEGLCPECRYDLRGLTVAGCPECGWNRSEESRSEGR